MLRFHLKIGFQLHNRRQFPALFLVLSLALLTAAYYVGGKDLKLEWVVSVLGVAVAFTTFLYNQHLQETRLFTELFKEFNERYDRLNARLNKITDAPESGIHGDDRQVLMDYFNLCAEEYLYFSAGYIDESVWGAWARGMKYYAEVPGIREFWEKEIQGGSYYGFSLQQL